MSHEGLILPGAVQTRIVEQEGRMFVGRTQDCTPIAEQAKALHNAGLHGSADVKHAASIPFVIVEKYCNDKGITFEEFMNGDKHIRAVLNDPSNDMFRIWKGAV